jgi:hypothetical protein
MRETGKLFPVKRAQGGHGKTQVQALLHLGLLVLLALAVVTPCLVLAHEKLPRKRLLTSNLHTSFNLASTISIDRTPPSHTYNTNLGTSTLLLATQDQQQPNQDYQIRKQLWANRYTSLQSLRETFGTNKNRLWGDLDAASARRLYKTLLPKALLELVQAGVQPEDLAPLAYQARVVAKLYARERCQLPSRILAALFDGFRTLRRYGRFQPVGMSYHQVWAKYEAQVLEDLEEAGMEEDQELIDAKVAVRKICLRILESSCRTNSNVDKWVLPSNPPEEKDSEELLKIAQTLENDVRKLLHPVAAEVKYTSSTTGTLRRWLARISSSTKGPRPS